jgi:coenzyme F420-reducing hydrogenase gamma subunit
MRYLGIEPVRPKLAVFDFTSCEGCQLQLVNKEDSLGPFLKSVEIVRFREASSAPGDGYDVALVEGAISRGDEVERLQKIRAQARVLVAFGSCACFGGVARLKNAFDLQEANREVYGDKPKPTEPARPVGDFVAVDLAIPGCPVSKEEVERVVRHVALGVPFEFTVYPVCVDCKQRFVGCLMERGQLCLGTITRAGCDAPCPAGGLGCWGCRGPAPEANLAGFLELCRERGFDPREVDERLGFFGGFEGIRCA